MVRSASVVQPLGPALQACLSRWERNTDSKRTRASLRGCAAPEAPEPNHPVSTIAATPNHRAVRPCCRNRRKGASMQMRANSAPLHPPDVAQNPATTSAGLKPQPARRPSAAPPGTGAACCRGRKPRRLQPRPPQRQNPRRVVAGYHQDHVSCIKRILCGKNQPFPFRGMHFTVDLEGSTLVIQSELFGPSGQRQVGLRTAYEDDIAMSKQVVRDFEVFVDRNSALVVIKEEVLHLLGGVSVRAGFTHRAVDDHRRGNLSVDVTGDVGRPFGWVDNIDAGASTIKE